MHSFTFPVARRMSLLPAVMVAALLMVTASAKAQSPAPAGDGPRTVSVSILHLNVSNLQKSLTLYRDVLGMELTAPLAPPRAGGALVTEPGAMLQTTILRVPGGSFSMELVEWSKTQLRPQQSRIQDPGAIMLAMNVRDLDAKLAAAKSAGFRVLSTGGVPFVAEGRGGRNRAVMIADPDGFIVELVEGGANANATGTGAITNVTIYLTVQDLAQTVTFYNRVLGTAMMPAGEARPTTERVQALFDNKGLATMRTARATFPGTDVSLNFQEFGIAGRKPVRHRVQDPGGPIFTMNVNDFPAAIAAVRANGGIIGDGETSVTLAADARASWVRDPNGLLIRLSPPAAPRGGGAAPATAPPGGGAR